MARRPHISGFTYEGGSSRRAEGPPPIPAPAARVARTLPRTLTVAVAVSSMVGEFRLRTGGAHSSELTRALRGDRGQTAFSLKNLAALAIEEGVDPADLVAYAVHELTRRSGGAPPRPAQVFSPRLADSWLARYRRNGAATLGRTPTVRVTEERLALWRARYGGRPNG